MKKIGRLTSAIFSPLAAILFALAIGAGLIALAGFNPFTAYYQLVDGVFGSPRNFAEVLLKSTPVILIGSGLAVAFRAGVWNIGAEGQFYMGAVATAAVALQMKGVHPAISIPLIMLSAILAGGAWAAIAGLCKAYAGTSEIVTTIMLNYIAIIFTSYLVTGPLQEAQGVLPQTDRFPRETLLPTLWPGMRTNIGIIIAVAVAALSWYLIFHSRRGFALQAVGEGPEAARYAGISIGNNIMFSICYSGGLAGLAGSIELLGVTKRLYLSISPGYGFEGIAVALLADNNPIGVIFSGTLFGALRSGSEIMQIGSAVPSVIVVIIQSLMIIAIAILGTRRARRISLTG